MNLLVIGAGGRTGREVVTQALGHGHNVRAFVRSTQPGITHPRLEIVTGDVTSFDDVDAAMEGIDAVISTIGSGNGREVRVYSEGIANVMHAMAVHGVSKLVAVSAGGVFARTDPKLSLGFRAMIATVLAPVYDDLERMEQRIAASGMDWTIVRPSGLSDGEQTGQYRLSLDGSLLPKAGRISRADVAAVLLKAAETQAFSRKTILVTG